MNCRCTHSVFYLIVFLLVVIIPACGPTGAEEEVLPDSLSSVVPEAVLPEPARQAPTQAEAAPTLPAEPSREAEEPTPTPSHSPAGPIIDKWSLWVDGPHLRGANIYQRRVYPELDGPEFMGPGLLGPPYTQEDFDRLAGLGANYVNISHPGLFSETPPYTLDQEVQDNLDHLLDLIAQADMFAVISFRTGPGRGEFSVCCLEEAGDWYDESYLNDAIWQDPEAQQAWAAMWRYTAGHYRDNPIVVGYDLMVEPNSNEVWLDIWDPEVFYADYGGTLYDWNQLHPRITAAIREVDPDTPILVGGMAYSDVEWLPYLEVTGDPRTVYAVHQYTPFPYTHQWLDSLELIYPGAFDTDWDGVDDQFNRAWLQELLSTVDHFASTHGVPVAVNEYGLMRWQPGAADFMDDQMGLFEERGINYALWVWETSWEPFAEEVHAFNFRLGPDPDNHTDVGASDLIDVIVKYWGRNTIRPSNVAEGLVAPTAEIGEAGDSPGQPEKSVSVLPAGSVVDDFESGDFDDRWWSYAGEGTSSFTCTLDQPGHASAQAMRLTFEVGADVYAGCGMDVDLGWWGEAGGLSFLWRADQPGLTMIVALGMEDPTQTNPEAEGWTPFEVELRTPGQEWTPATLVWENFAKAEWVGEGGVDVLDPTRVNELYFEIVDEQSGSIWFDNLQLTDLEVAIAGPTVPPTDTPEPTNTPDEILYYVAPTGSDSNPGTEAQPWATIQKAANTLVAGDTVYVRAGTYQEQVIPLNSGIVGNYITYAAYPGETVTIDGASISLPAYETGLFVMEDRSYIKVSGLRIINAHPNDNNAGIYVDNSHHIIIENNYTYNTASSGIGIWDGSNIIIDGNEVRLACNDGEQEDITVAGTDTFEVKNNHVHDGGPGTNGGEGITIKDGARNGKVYKNHVHDIIYGQRTCLYVDAWDKETYNIEVYQNILHNCAAGISLASENGGLLRDVRIYNNIVYGNISNGLEIGNWGEPWISVRPIQNATFINNTVYSNGNVWGGGFFNENPNVSNVVVRNNIFSQNLTFQIANEKATTLNVDHNLIDGYRGDPAEIRGSDYVEGDPKFVNASSADFHLQSSSAAIDQGSATDAPTNDYDGSPRPQDGEGDGTAIHDIGAYEVVPSLSLSCVTDPHPVEAITQLITLLPGFCDRGNHQW